LKRPDDLARNGVMKGDITLAWGNWLAVDLLGLPAVDQFGSEAVGQVYVVVRLNAPSAS
jgi:hypothetical protein